MLQASAIMHTKESIMHIMLIPVVHIMLIPVVFMGCLVLQGVSKVQTSPRVVEHK